MKVSVLDVGGEVVKKDERYTVKDNCALVNLVLSSTDLNPGKSTSGHSHAGQEEVYNFVKGTGEMKIDEKVFSVSEGDVVLIPDGAFHRVRNDSSEDLYFVCVFEGEREH